MSVLTSIRNAVKEQKPKPAQAPARRTIPADVFHKFYQEHAEKIFKFVYYKVGSRETAEDLTSETFLKTWRHIETNQIENIRAFVYRVANNLVIDHWRRKDREPLPLPDEDDGQELPATEVDLDRFLDNHINGKVLAHALEEIHPNYRDVLVLRYINDLSPDEIASIIGKTLNNVNVLTFRALKALKTHMAIFYAERI